MKFDSFYIGSASFLLEFATPMESIKFEQQRAESAFRPLIGVQSQQTNVPDNAPSPVPRTLFSAEGRVISLSPLGVQLDLNFEPGQAESTLDSIGDQFLAFESATLENFSVAPYSNSALIVLINLPSKKTTDELADYLHNVFFNDYRWGGEIANAQFALGFRKAGCFLNVAGELYERRQIDFAGASPSLGLNRESMKFIEGGVSFKFDVNGRPRAKLGEPRLSLLEGLRELKHFMAEDFRAVSGLNIL